MSTGGDESDTGAGTSGDAVPAIPGPLDERALRRPDFAGGVAVVLADGQEWLIPRPSMLFVPDDNEDGFRVEWDLGPEYDALIAGVEQAEGGNRAIGAEMKLFRWLILRNYNLTTPQLASVLKISYAEHNEGPYRIWRDLNSVAFGQEPAPKASPAGSG